MICIWIALIITGSTGNWIPSIHTISAFILGSIQLLIHFKLEVGHFQAKANVNEFGWVDISTLWISSKFVHKQLIDLYLAIEIRRKYCLNASSNGRPDWSKFRFILLNKLVACRPWHSVSHSSISSFHWSFADIFQLEMDGKVEIELKLMQMVLLTISSSNFES